MAWQTVAKSASKTVETPADLPVWSDPERVGGVPCFRGTRVPVEGLFENLEDGVSLDEFLDAFPAVPREQAVAVLAVIKPGDFVETPRK